MPFPSPPLVYWCPSPTHTSSGRIGAAREVAELEFKSIDVVKVEAFHSLIVNIDVRGGLIADECETTAVAHREPALAPGAQRLSGRRGETHVLELVHLPRGRPAGVKGAGQEVESDAAD